MSLAINHNLMTMNAYRNLSDTHKNLASSTRRLSSGLRVQTAADDAAGLAIRELMRSNISSLNQGVRNANDAISMIQTADGALQVIDEKLIRMKELAEQAATGTYTSDQRLIIDSEYQAMTSEITRIAEATEFNGISLLNGRLSGSVHNGSGMNPTGKMKIHFGTGNDSAEDYYYIQIGSATANSLGFGPPNRIGMTEEEFAKRNNLDFLSTHPSSPSDTFSNHISFMIEPIPDVFKTEFSDDVKFNEYSVKDKPNTYVVTAKSNNGDLWFFEYEFAGYSPPPVTEQFRITDYGKIYTENANEPSRVNTQVKAQYQLEKIDSAKEKSANIRANLGATQNRLANTVTNLKIQAENLRAAESRISDVDVAKEMTKFIRNQILSQSAVSMLSQANTMPRMALQLIQG